MQLHLAKSPAIGIALWHPGGTRQPVHNEVPAASRALAQTCAVFRPGRQAAPQRQLALKSGHALRISLLDAAAALGLAGLTVGVVRGGPLACLIQQLGILRPQLGRGHVAGQLALLRAPRITNGTAGRAISHAIAT
jgi:hypothetical protein